MSQSLWTFYDPSSGKQTVGMYHGEETGHVVVYCNNQVVIIDFKVKQSKSYSFVINDSMVKLELKKNKNGFEYIFENELTNDIGKSETEDVKIYTLGYIIVVFMLLLTFFNLMTFVLLN